MSQQEQAQPTKEEVIAFLNESIEIAELRAKLQTLNTQIAVGRAEELKALVVISQITNPSPEDPLETYNVTQEDIDQHPDLSKAGVKEGDTIQVPSSVKRKLSRKTNPSTEEVTTAE